MKENLKTIWSFAKDVLHPLSNPMVMLMGAIISIVIPKMLGIGTLTNILYIWICFFCSDIGYQIAFRKQGSIINNLEVEIKEKESEIDKKNAIINEKDKQIGKGALLLENKYGELAEFVNNKQYKKVLGLLIKRFPYIESIQVHNYVSIPREDVILFKVENFLTSNKEGININVLDQQYYEFERKYFIEYRNIINHYSNQIDNNKALNNCTINNNYLNQIKDIIDDINDKIINFIDGIIADNSASKYNNIILINDLIKLLIELNPEYASTFNTPNTMEYKGIKIDLKKVNRTGIISSIIRSSDTIYAYNKLDNTKSHRVYFTFLDIIELENKSVTFILKPNSEFINNTDKDTDIKDIRDNLKEIIGFYEDLIKSFK